MTTPPRYQPRGSSAQAIYDDVEAAIRAGRLRPGQHLPPVRSLAAILGFSPGTVAASYRRLRERGLLTAHGRRGTVVADRPPVPVHPVLSVPPGVRNLADGNPDPTLLPDLAPALAALDVTPRLYGQPTKADGLVEVVGRQFEADGVPASSLAVVAGAMDGMERLLQAHLGPGDRVAVEDPGYTGVLDLLPALGLIPVPVPVDDHGILPDALERALAGGVAAVVLTPRAQNPMGSALDQRRSRALRRLLGGHPGVLVIEDDHAGAVAGVPFVTVCRGLLRWAVVRSFSKSLGPDLRLAVVVGDVTTVARVEGRLGLGPGWVSHLLQRTVARLMADEAVAVQLRRAADTYTERRQALLGALGRHGIHAYGRSGMNVWVPVPEEQAVVRALLDAGWAVAAGERYRRQTRPGLRITVSTLVPAEAEELAAALARVFRPAGHTRSA
jgi:DNA-binding transcriptional MocR family regulator